MIYLVSGHLVNRIAILLSSWPFCLFWSPPSPVENRDIDSVEEAVVRLQIDGMMI